MDCMRRVYEWCPAILERPVQRLLRRLHNMKKYIVSGRRMRKWATETAIGACIAGSRAFSGMKHVGLNVAADPLYTASYTGVNAGLVIGVADDPGMHSSQNEQDSRHHAIAAKLAMLEPADSTECLEYTKLAYTLSEEFDTPVMLRLTTRIAHSRSLVEEHEPQEAPEREFDKDPQKYVMMPAMAIKRHAIIEERQRKLQEYAETAPINQVEDHGAKIGVIAAGICYQYAREALGRRSELLEAGYGQSVASGVDPQFCQAL